MSSTCRLSIACALLAFALIAPASALGHGSVFETVALVNCTGPTAGPVTCADQRQYAFTNHGFTAVLRESNGRTANGAINYKRAPSLLRGVPGFNVLTSDAVTGVQPHATCNVPALTTDAAIRGWQGTDPFYAYIPFQKAAAGYEDTPALWIEDVKTLTGVDLATVADAGVEAACEALPGANASSYAPADATVTTFTALAAGTIAEEKAPLEADKAALTAQVASLAAELGSMTGAKNAATTEVASLKAAHSAALAQIATLESALRPLRVTPPPAAPSPAALAKDGLAATLGGPAGKSFSVRMKISAASAKKLRLRSRILGSKSVTIGDDGSATVQLMPTPAAAAGLPKQKGPLGLAIEATGGDRWSLRSIVLPG